MMPLGNTVKLSDPAYERLKEFRDAHEHTSFDSAIRELLTERGVGG